MSLRLLPYENVFYCHYETCVCFVLQITKLAFFYLFIRIMLTEGFDTVYYIIYTVIFHNYDFISCFYLLLITVCIIIINIII